MQNKNFAKNPLSNVPWKYGNKIAKKRFTVPVNNVNSNLKISEPAEFPYLFDKAGTPHTLTLLLISN